MHDLRKKRYQSFDSGKGKDFESGKLELKDLYEIAKDANEISPESGKQELFENILNQYLLNHKDFLKHYLLKFF